MYLFGLNLRDAGEFQKKFDREHSELLSRGGIDRMVLDEKFLSVARTEEAEAVRIIKRRFGFYFDEYEPGMPIDEDSIEGMVVADFDHKAMDRAVIEGERYLRIELTKCTIHFYLFLVTQTV